jgi:ATP-dependent Lhr-like helicase
MSGIERLHPHLQHAIIHDLGWRSLRPVQDLTIDAVLDGCNTVVLAPTAGGKTEAAMFPLLSRILSEGLRPVSVLYVCPIRALLNNQEERLQSYARMVGIDVFKWHGDVSASRKQGFRDAPAHILMTTPESLEVMLISAKTDARAIFEGLSAVVIDEVHAFAADDRGAHLASVMERLVSMCGRDVQRIGLSATVGNPEVIGQWLQGSSQRPFRLVDPPRPRAERVLRLDLCADIHDAAVSIGQLAQGKKSLVFVESRSKAEKVAHALAGTSVEVFIHHSSVSRADRALAEEQFARGRNTAIVCTSTMELGIDVGDLDQVIQVDAPGSVASFLQRLGRTGRRPNTRASCAFFCLSSESLLQSVALLRLAEAGWVEDVQPAAHAMHVLAHQVMALILQEGGISRHKLLPWIDEAYPFTSIRPERLHELVDTMLERQILYEADGLLSLGQRGEKLYGRKNFFELYAVFTAPPVMRVQHGKEDIGYVQALFVSMHDREKGPLCFRLSGRAWEVGQVDWSKGVLHVRPAEHGRVPSWLGLPGVLSTKLCQAMMDVLLREQAEQEAGWLTRAAAAELGLMRESYAGLLEEGTAPLEDVPDGVQWHTFAGGAVNRLLAAGLEGLTGRKWVAGNLSVRCKDIAATAASEAVGGLAQVDWEGTVIHRSARHGSRHVEQVPALLAGRRRGPSAGRTSSRPPRHVALSRHRQGQRCACGRQASWRSSGRRRHRRQPAACARRFRRHQRRGSSAQRGGVDRYPRRPEPGQRGTAERRHPRARRGDHPRLRHSLPRPSGHTHEDLPDRPLSAGDLTPLVDVMGSAQPIKVIHNARFERRVLATVGITIEGVFDTLEASRRLRGKDALGGHSLAMVCERELGLVLDKAEQTSNWAHRPLDADQLRYAALDAEVLLALYDRLVLAP